MCRASVPKPCARIEAHYPLTTFQIIAPPPSVEPEAIHFPQYLIWTIIILQKHELARLRSNAIRIVFIHFTKGLGFISGLSKWLIRVSESN